MSMKSFLFIIFVSIVASFDETVQDQEVNCTIDGSISKCMFNQKNQLAVNLGPVSSLQLVVNSGKKVECQTMATTNGWYGEQCDGNARDANIIQRKDHNGLYKVFGSIRIGADICQIKPNATGVEEMTCIPEQDIPPEGEAIEPQVDNNEEYDAHIRNLHVGFDPTHLVGGATDSQGRLLYDDSGSNIDVMVVWTNDAECQNSGLPAGCTRTATTDSNMRGVIDLLVEETNTAFSLSGMRSSLRLVHAYRDPTYVEPAKAAADSPKEPFLVAIQELANTTDGKLDSVHKLRTLYGADMVQLIIGQVSFCGRGYLSTLAVYAFSVISAQCTIGGSTYAHEIGHNCEMNHDRGTEDSCNAAGYNFGYRAPTATLCSIMAYTSKVGQCDNMPKDGCIRAQRFSNTQYPYNGQPIGDAKNNNALQFNNVRGIIASHFPAMNCKSNGQCNDNNVNTVDTCNFSKAVCVFTPSPSAPRPRPVASPSAPRPRPVASPSAPRPRPVASPSAPRPRPVASPSAPRPKPVASPSAPRPRPVASPSAPRPKPVASPSAPNPVPSPSAPRPIPVPSPSAPRPVPSPSAPNPVASPSAPRPVPSPSAPIPVPSAPRPVASPSAPRPVASPTIATASVPRPWCGWLGHRLGVCGR